MFQDLSQTENTDVVHQKKKSSLDNFGFPHYTLNLD